MRPIALIAVLIGLFAPASLLAQPADAPLELRTIPQAPAAPQEPGAGLAPGAVQPQEPGVAQPPQAPVANIPMTLRVRWEVKNRFRLFRNESDFLRHVDANRGDGILAAERRLAMGSGGHGWARLTVNALCVDAAGRILDVCERDGVRESYLNPTDHRVGVVVDAPPAGATCTWTFEAADEQPRSVAVPCTEEVTLRVRYGTSTFATVKAALPDGSAQGGRAELLVRDLLVAGIGDSIASGEGNPDRAVVLDDDGFCFRRFIGNSGGEYFRPSRAGYRGNKTCETTTRDDRALRDWTRRGAGWMSAACHRSLYSYQVRTMLALAVETPHIAVTFLPLACTGAEIETGLLDGQRAREVTCGGRGRTGPCPSRMPGQIAQMNGILKAARRTQPERTFDLVLLTIGANDVRFSELVSNVLLDQSADRTLLGSRISSVEAARSILQQELPGKFSRLRAALRPLVGGDLGRVVFVSYPDPALHDGGAPCGGGREGVDIHPSFNVNAETLSKTTAFVDREFLPRIRDLAQCEGGVICKGNADRMTFVDAHQPAFADPGFCAHAESDPAFDRACLSVKGESFQSDLRLAAEHPLVCNMRPRDFRPYAPRARWVRTPNDSYFTSMTYPDGLPSVTQPADIHDAAWGILSAVYGGAIHPTAEGYAVMADAALPAVRGVLHLNAASLYDTGVTSAPLPFGTLPMQQPASGAPGTAPAAPGPVSSDPSLRPPARIQ
jgi:hypothetical protein